jgi:hypothetical protein
MAALRNYADLRGTSHFTTRAAKFVPREAGVAGRRHAWQDREVPLDEQPWASDLFHRPVHGPA